MELKFNEFLQNVADSKIQTNITANGVKTVQQTQRNKLRKEGEVALFEDLYNIYEKFDVLQTAEGICIVVSNDDCDFTIELKLSIKSLDFDAYEESDAFIFAEEEKKRAAIEKAQLKEEKIKRQQKLREQAKILNAAKKSRKNDSF